MKGRQRKGYISQSDTIDQIEFVAASDSSDTPLTGRATTKVLSHAASASSGEWCLVQPGHWSWTQLIPKFGSTFHRQI